MCEDAEGSEELQSGTGHVLQVRHGRCLLLCNACNVWRDKSVERRIRRSYCRLCAGRLVFFQSFPYTASEIAAAISIWEDAVDAGVDLPSALGIGHAFIVGRWRWPLEQRKRRWPTPRRPAGRQEALGCPRCHARESSYVVGYVDGIHAGRRKRTWHSSRHRRRSEADALEAQHRGYPTLTAFYAARGRRDTPAAPKSRHHPRGSRW